MKITNHHGLPEPFVRAIVQSQARYKSTLGDSDITVTQLIKPPRMTALEAKHWPEVEEDAMDRFWALLGSAVHYLLELGASDVVKEIAESSDPTGEYRKAADEGKKNIRGTFVAERRWSNTIDGWRVSGMGDLVDGQILRDYKVVRAAAIKDGVKEEWEKQLNALRYLAHSEGTDVDELEIVAILRDWNHAQTADPSYPKTPVVVLPVQAWGEGYALKWIQARVKAHKEARYALPECSDEDRWYRGECWAIMKKGRKSAVKLHYNQESAEKHLETLDKNHSIVHRPGTNVRCERYCSVAPFCEQWKKLKGTDHD